MFCAFTGNQTATPAPPPQEESWAVFDTEKVAPTENISSTKSPRGNNSSKKSFHLQQFVDVNSLCVVNRRIRKDGCRISVFIGR